MLQVNIDPFPLITTGRLLLRQLVPPDADALFDLRSDKEIMQYIGRPLHITIDDTRAFMRILEEQTAKQDMIFWVICLKEDPSFMIGNICYWRIQKDHYRAELGYMLHKNHWKKGYMKEVLEEIIKYGFNRLGLHSIEAATSPFNEGSIRVLKAKGFEQEGHLKENYFHNGAFTDSLIFSLVNRN